MTKLACRYGIDAARPEIGIIVESAADDQVLDMAACPDCLYLELRGPHEQWGRHGPAPQLMGEPPRSHHKSHAELDAEGHDAAHPLREIAGWPIKDNRRLETDMRPWRAPDLTPDIARLAKRLEMARALDAAAAAGFVSAALGGDLPRRYPTDADSLTKLQLAAVAAIMGSRKDGWTALLRCAEVDRQGVVGPFGGVTHTPMQIHDVLADYQAWADALHVESDAVEAGIAAAETVADILAVSRP